MTDWNLLAKYLDEQCSPAEVEAVARWSSSDPGNAAELELLRRAWRRAAELPSAPRIEALWERIAHSAGIAPPAAEAASVPSMPAMRRVGAARRRDPFGEGGGHRFRRFAIGLTSIAAAVVVATTAREVVRSRAHVTTVAARDTVTREYRTARGQRATIVLLDGTRVKLGVDSRLRVTVPTTAGSGERVAYLDGEALFEVAHVESQPFSVHAGAAIARDIGTTFGVRAYEDEAPRVVVVEGSVAVRDSARGDSAAAVLRANDLARVEPGELEVERGIDPRPYVAWSEGRLEFHRAPLTQVAAQLERVYDVRIAIEDSTLRGARVNATFDDRDGVDSVLHALAASLDASIVRRGQDVTVRARR